MAAVFASSAGASPAISTTMPVLGADMTADTVSVQLPRSVMGQTRATSTRMVTVEAFDSRGQSLGTSTVSISRRIPYASIKLSPAMTSAARIEVSAR
jgi:hypothetical protein